MSAPVVIPNDLLNALYWVLILVAATSRSSNGLRAHSVRLEQPNGMCLLQQLTPVRAFSI
jgi:hypothetical protein